MLKTIVYIDGYNLYYRLRKTPYKWLNPLKLCHLILPIVLPNKKIEIVKVKFFTAKIKLITPEHKKNQTRQEIYWRALETISNLEIIHGKYKRKTSKGVLLDKKGKETGKIRSIKTFEEKESDVSVAVNMISGAYERKDCKQFILISNDTDLVPAIKYIKQNLEKKILILSPTRGRIHRDIVNWSHKQTIIKDNHLCKSQFQEELSDRNGIFHKPLIW